MRFMLSIDELENTYVNRYLVKTESNIIVEVLRINNIQILC